MATLESVAREIVDGWLEHGATVDGSLTSLAAGDIPTQADIEWADKQLGRGRLSPQQVGDLAGAMGDILRTMRDQEAGE